MRENPLSAALDQLFELLLTSASPERFPGTEGELQIALLINARLLERQGKDEASMALQELAGRIPRPNKGVHH